ncbi:DegT/DnrJ/EryC1/StrS aminotransferase [mine drainage metagenome]|uniref:DegT/DnrJ/EryC1/StrS aminotransferase n=1 Tax=mine drainage metagenome TaxID=410659 RepID=T1AUN1_9ZZZZ
MFAALLPLDRLRIDRAEFIEAMAARGIGIGVHYPAIHLFSAYRALGYREGQFPNAERIGRETVTLPLFPAMSDSDPERVVTAVNEVLRGALR